jgi:hypothetical protein
MTSIVPVEKTARAKLERALDMVVDRMIGSASGVAGYVAKLREQHPKLSDRQLARLIVSRKSLKSGFVGFATGLPGLTLLPAAIPVDLVANWQVQITMVLAVAHAFGHTADTTDLKTDIYLVLAGDAAKEALKRAGITAARDVTYRVVDRYVTREVMQQIWKVVGPKVITKAGAKSLTSIVELVPGVGGIVGFVFDWTATAAVGRFAIGYYGGDDVAETKVMSTWGGRGEFAYTGCVKDGVVLRYGADGRYSCEISKQQWRSLLTHFRGRTVPIGTSRTDPPEGSLGEWLQQHVTKTALASYVGPILLAEGYADRPSSSEITFRRGRGKGIPLSRGRVA